MTQFGRETRLLAVREQVGRDPDRRVGRVDVRPPRDVLLQYVVLDRTRQLPHRHALLLPHRDVQPQQHSRRSVDRHRRRHLVQRDPVEQRLHVRQRIDGNAYLLRCDIEPNSDSQDTGPIIRLYRNEFLVVNVFEEDIMKNNVTIFSKVILENRTGD